METLFNLRENEKELRANVLIVLAVQKTKESARGSVLFFSQDVVLKGCSSGKTKNEGQERRSQRREHGLRGLGDCIERDFTGKSKQS